MEIKGVVHCFFEQSGTFKKEFEKLGYKSYDYDIQNDFGETDFVIDLFNEIKKGYVGGASIFDTISKDDLIIAFFPCIYFESLQMTYYSLESINYRKKTMEEKIKSTVDRIIKRADFHVLLYKLVYMAEKKGLRLIIENPATKPNYLIDTQNFIKPTFVDQNRMLRGDFYKKPTAYWFYNCEPTVGFSHQNDKEQKTIMKTRGSKQAGICGKERSLISSDYARNWICDFVLGKKQEKFSENYLFDFV